MGGTITYTVTALTSAGATGNLVNTVTVTPPAGGTPGTSTDTDTPAPVSNLTASKDDGSTTYLPGGQAVYTIVVGNTGPSDAVGVTVSDPKPAQVASWTWACSGATGGATGCDGAASNSANFTDTVNLPVGATITYTVTAQISAGATGNLVNTVTATPPAGGTPGTATDTDTPAPSSGMTASKTDGVETYTPGQQVVYTIVVGNTGPSDAIGAVVSDPKPAQIASWTWVCSGATGGATGCDPAASNSADFTDTVNLPVGSSITYTVTALTSAGATGNLVNTVTVTPPGGGTPGTSTDTDTPAPVSNLIAGKDDGSTTYLPGGQAVYTIVVGNTGPSDAVGVTVSDPKPAQVTSWTWVCSGATGGATGCDPAASNSADFTDTVNLPVGATITYTVTAQISASATGNLVNTVTATPPAGGTPGTATDTDTPAPTSNMTASKNDGITQYTPNTTTTYTIVVGNNGPSDAIGAVVSDPKPSQITSWTWECTGATGGATGCDPAASNSANFTDTVNLPVGSTITYTVTAQIGAGATGNLVNTVTVTPPGGGTPGTSTDTNTPPPPPVVPVAQIPTLGEYALIALMLLLATAGGLSARRIGRKG